MQATSPTNPTTTARQGHSAFSIMVATFVTMIVVLLISNFSFPTSIALGSFAGFCMAAWNWSGRGKRRKALIHLLLGLGVYLLFPVSYGLLAAFLYRVIPPVELVVAPSLAPIPIPNNGPIISPQPNPAILPLLMVYCFGVGALVLFYLYRVTVRDIPRIDPADNNFEIDLKRFLPLLGIAAISSVAITLVSSSAAQIRTAQMQNHVYCELLHLDMTEEEVATSLKEISPFTYILVNDWGPQYRRDDDGGKYHFIFWDKSDIESKYDLWLWVGFDKNGKLDWKGRYSSSAKLTPIQCPWTFSQSVVAR